MKRVVTEQWIAFDGVPFPIGAAGEAAAESACRAYEAKLAHVRLVDLKIEQIEAALSGSDPDLADAIEQIGARIGRARRERGELKRGHKDIPGPARAITGPAASADIRADEGRERSVVEIIESLKDDTSEGEAA